MLVAADEPGSGIDGLQALRKTTLGDVHIPTGTVVIGVMRRRGRAIATCPAPRRRLRVRALAGRGRPDATEPRESLQLAMAPVGLSMRLALWA